MTITRNIDGVVIATGRCNGVPYVAEGNSYREAMSAALLLIQFRHLHTLLKNGSTAP